MRYDDIVDLLKNNSREWIISHNKADIIELTNFLPDGAKFTQRFWHILNNSHEIVACPICNNAPARFGTIEVRENGKYVSKHNGYRPCSDACTRKLMSEKATVIVNTKEFKAKRDNTLIEKYGTTNHMQLDEIKNKVRKTTTERYGVDSVLKLKANKDKAIEVLRSVENKAKNKAALMEKHGVNHNMKIPGVKEKSVNTLIKKYGTDNYSKTQDFKNKISEYRTADLINSIPPEYLLVGYDKDNITLEHGKCDGVFTMTRKFYHARKSKGLMICSSCLPIEANISNAEIELYEYIKSIYSGEVISRHRYEGNKEIDIYIPALKLGIEYNGSWWHSDEYKNHKSHMIKMDDVNRHGMSLMYVWDYQWFKKRDIIKSIISTKIGINEVSYARKYKIMKVDSKTLRRFLEENHIQGWASSICAYGLVDQHELKEVMSFSKNIHGVWEISRLCTKLGLSIIGGANRLFSSFVAEHNPDLVISYCARDLFSGVVYRKMGFLLESTTTPRYWYINKEMDYLSRQSCQKHKLVSMGFSVDKTESSIMKERGYYKCYDSGNLKFTWSRRGL